MTSPRTVLLTGSSRGIGREIRDMLLQESHTVIGIARQPDMENPPATYQPISLDLSQVDDLDQRLKKVLVSLPAIDTVILNAGGPAFGNLEELSAGQIRQFIDLNLTSHLLVARAVLPRLKRHDQSDLIVIGSEAALQGGRRGSIYCAAKFGLRGFTQSLRQECAASGVRVTMIQPGMVRTSFFDDLDFQPGAAPENAIEPRDVAEAVQLVIGARPGTVFDEIVLSPLKNVVRTKS